MSKKEKIAYFNVDGMGTVRVNVRNVCTWFERLERAMYVNDKIEEPLPDIMYVIIEMNNQRVFKVRDSIQTVDEKLS